MNFKIGDNIEIIENKKDSCINEFYDVGAKGQVVAIDKDGDLEVRFYSDVWMPNKEYNNTWFVDPYSCKKINV